MVVDDSEPMAWYEKPQPWVNLQLLSRRQRQRLRETRYWQNVFLHYHKKLARWWRQERLREWHDFEEAIEEHLNLMASRPDLLKSNVGGKPSSKVRHCRSACIEAGASPWGQVMSRKFANGLESNPYKRNV